MRRDVRSAVVALVVALAGCADSHLLAGQTAGRSVAVAAPVGAQLNLLVMDTFLGERGKVAVPDWGLEEAVSRSAMLALQQTKRYPIVKVVTGLDRNPADFLKSDALRDSDFLILIEPESSGIGLSQRTIMGGIQCVAQVRLKGELFDLRTGQSLARDQHLTYWQVPQKLDPGPRISDADLRELREPMLSRASEAVQQLLRKLGLR